MEIINKKTWEEFCETGLLWWVNRTLHLFGWTIVVNMEVDDGSILEVYPAKCKFRGFDENTEKENFKQLTKHIKDNLDDLIKDCEG